MMDLKDNLSLMKNWQKWINIKMLYLMGYRLVYWLPVL